MNALLEEIDKYKELLDIKDELAEKTKANNKEIEEQKKLLCQMMIDEEVANVDRCGYVYSLKEATKYSKRSEEYLYENGLDFFGVLRAEGLGELIQEKVDARSLNAAIRDYVEENGELSGELESVLTIYEDMNITKTKSRKRA